jgi:hypothetical protein
MTLLFDIVPFTEPVTAGAPRREIYERFQNEPDTLVVYFAATRPKARLFAPLSALKRPAKSPMVQPLSATEGAA